MTDMTTLIELIPPTPPLFILAKEDFLLDRCPSGPSYFDRNILRITRNLCVDGALMGSFSREKSQLRN